MRLRMQEILYFCDLIHKAPVDYTVVNNNLLFKKNIYIYIIIVVLNRSKYFVKIPIDIVIQ